MTMSSELQSWSVIGWSWNPGSSFCSSKTIKAATPRDLKDPPHPAFCRIPSGLQMGPEAHLRAQGAATCQRVPGNSRVQSLLCSLATCSDLQCQPPSACIEAWVLHHEQAWRPRLCVTSCLPSKCQARCGLSPPSQDSCQTVPRWGTAAVPVSSRCPHVTHVPAP